MKVVYPKPERCINCHLCEVACIVEHSKTRNPIGAHFHEGLSFNFEQSRDFPDPAEAKEAGRPSPSTRCRVWTQKVTFISTMCRHCEVPACLLACKNGSLYKDPTGRVLVDEDKCVGCWMCIMACPYGVITRNVERQNVPEVTSNGINHHCDLCPNRSTPACVTVCPTQALVFEDRDNGQGESTCGM
jgi:carbon-monoxide dehydrogenase iron sulfur subunit